MKVPIPTVQNHLRSFSNKWNQYYCQAGAQLEGMSVEPKPRWSYFQLLALWNLKHYPVGHIIILLFETEIPTITRNNWTKPTYLPGSNQEMNSGKLYVWSRMVKIKRHHLEPRGRGLGEDMNTLYPETSWVSTNNLRTFLLLRSVIYFLTCPLL